MSAVRWILLFSAIAAVAFANAITQKQLDTAFSTIDTLKQQLTDAQARLASLKMRQKESNSDLDTMWFVLNFIVMLFMIPAFALREMGTSRLSDTRLYIMKYVLLLSVSAICYWLVGYGAMFGSSPNSNRNAFIGNTDYILVSSGYGATTPAYTLWSYEWTKVAVSLAILFSAFGERVSIYGYVAVSVVYTVWIYPVAGHWIWGPSGWISIYNDSKSIGRAGSQGAIDYAGSCVVHICGGAGALAALIYLGARKNPKNSFSNPTLVLIGVLLYWFSHYGFTAGETWGLSGVGVDSLAHHASKICFTVTLAASGGGIGSLILSKLFARSQPLNNNDLLNGILAGLVASASGSGLYDEYAGFLIGLIAGAAHHIVAAIVDAVGLDDGLRTTGIHLASGWIGMIGTGFWARDADILRGYPFLVTRGAQPVRYGILYGGGAQLFGLNLLASLAVTVWSFFFVLATLWVTNWFGILFLTEAEQENGTDFESAISEEHGSKLLGHDYEKEMTSSEPLSITDPAYTVKK